MAGTAKWILGVCLILSPIASNLAAWGEDKKGADQKGDAVKEQRTEKGEPKDRDPSFWMRQKMLNSERILEGLARGDLDQVNQAATALKGLNRIEAFIRREPPAYRTQLSIFQYSVDELIRTSEADNLDGAALAFTQMTISCVNCHKQLRK